MSEEAWGCVKAWLGRAAGSVEGVMKAFVSDKEGVPLFHAAGPASESGALRPALLTAYGTSLQQTDKIRLGAQVGQGDSGRGKMSIQLIVDIVY